MQPIPPDWLNRLPELSGPLPLVVAGYPVEIILTGPELQNVYLPMLALLDRQARSSRVLAGLAGIPGSGKSTFTAALACLADRLLGEADLVAVGIDGWHLPNVILDRRTTLDVAGAVVPLRQRKGGPESFDVPALVRAVQQLADRTRTIRLPAYDRRLHDPVPDVLSIPPETRIVLVEGNYLLDDAPPWNAVGALLSPIFLLTCDPDPARRRVIDRHVRGGCTPAQAEYKYESNDGLNARVVLEKTHRADWTIRLAPDPQLQNTRPAPG